MQIINYQLFFIELLFYMAYYNVPLPFLWLPNDFMFNYLANLVPNYIAFFLKADVYLNKELIKMANFNPKLEAIFLRNILSPDPLGNEKSVKIFGSSDLTA